jgi:hypothetical protein
LRGGDGARRRGLTRPDSRHHRGGGADGARRRGPHGGPEEGGGWGQTKGPHGGADVGWGSDAEMVGLDGGRTDGEGIHTEGH